MGTPSPSQPPISWFFLLTTKMGYPYRQGRLEKRIQEGPIHRSHSETVFSLDFDLRPCLDSPASRPRSETVSGHGPVKSGEGRPYLGLLLTSRGFGLTGQTSSQGTEPPGSTGVFQHLHPVQSDQTDMKCSLVGKGSHRRAAFSLRVDQRQSHF